MTVSVKDLVTQNKSQEEWARVGNEAKLGMLMFYIRKKSNQGGPQAVLEAIERLKTTVPFQQLPATGQSFIAGYGIALYHELVEQAETLAKEAIGAVVDVAF